jgi:hypothetical protein
VDTKKKHSTIRISPEHDPSECLREIRAILIKKGLLDSDEGLNENMLEDLVHYAYFTSCIPRGDVQRLLGLSAEEAKARIRVWKKWQDGNRSCQLQQNPFYAEWPAEGDEDQGG